LDLHGKTILITGGARHIGREIALAAAARGADVAITYLESQRAAEQLLRDLERQATRAVAVHCDVRDERSVRRAVGEIIKRLGGIDVLVNNAAIYETVAFDKISVKQWDNIFATNARGPFLVTQACLPSLRGRLGRIINLGSLGGLRPWPTHAHYCASKAALTMLSQSMARALAPEVAVNCVAPGMIETERTQRRGAPLSKKLAARTPMRLNGTPADVAAAVLFFATAPHFITGQTLVVDGGLSLV
jgi:3-oxoacyl-[acyl-carrier protein] reductase/pteridine reductase